MPVVTAVSNIHSDDHSLEAQCLCVQYIQYRCMLAVCYLQREVHVQSSHFL